MGTAWLGHLIRFAVDDHGVAALKMMSGATATLEGGWADRKIHFEVEVLGTVALARIAMRADGGHAEIVGRDGDIIWSDHTGPIDAGLAMVPFLRAVRDGTPPLVDAEHSAAVVETLERLYGRN